MTDDDAPGGYQYRMLDHLCRFCLNRLTERQDGQGGTIVCCIECGVEVAEEPEALCWCGVKLASGRNAGFRCIVNPNQTPEFPLAVVVRYAPVAEEERERVSRKVLVGGTPW